MNTITSAFSNFYNYLLEDPEDVDGAIVEINIILDGHEVATYPVSCQYKYMLDILYARAEVSQNDHWVLYETGNQHPTQISSDWSPRTIAGEQDGWYAVISNDLQEMFELYFPNSWILAETI